jgi:hypothetical protein
VRVGVDDPRVSALLASLSGCALLRSMRCMGGSHCAALRDDRTSSGIGAACSRLRANCSCCRRNVCSPTVRAASHCGDMQRRAGVLAPCRIQPKEPDPKRDTRSSYMHGRANTVDASAMCGLVGAVRRLRTHFAYLIRQLHDRVMMWSQPNCRPA